MIPILYESTETVFASNGLGRLRDCISCKVTEERNGIYECDFEYPTNGSNYDKIRLGRIIAVEHDDTNDVQPFDIVSYSKPIDGVVTFHAVHISYRQSKLTVTGSGINSLADALTLLGTASPSNPFSYSTDMTSSAYLAAANGIPISVRQLLGGVEGSILDAYGGEFEWNRFNVKLWSSRGSQRSLTIRYGVNMTEYNEDMDYSGTYTAVIPYWESGEDRLVGSMVESGYSAYNGQPNCIPLNLTDKFESMPTAADLEAAALSYMRSNQTHLPATSISVSFIQLEDSAEYEDYAPLLRCKLCDSVNVVFPEYGTQGSFKIVKTVYDVLLERYESLELGNLSTSLAEALGISQSLSSSGGSGGGEAADYVTSQGTSDNWHYRKWNSGKVEAWFTGTVSCGGTTATGSIYYADGTLSIPSGIFSSAPECIAEMRSSTSDALAAAVFEVAALATSATSLSVRVHRASANTSSTSIKANIYAWTN